MKKKKLRKQNEDMGRHVYQLN